MTQEGTDWLTGLPLLVGVEYLEVVCLSVLWDIGDSLELTIIADMPLNDGEDDEPLFALCHTGGHKFILLVMRVLLLKHLKYYTRMQVYSWTADQILMKLIPQCKSITVDQILVKLVWQCKFIVL